MKYRLLGKSGLRVSEAALGTMTFGDEWGWGSPKAEAQKVYETYREAGGNFLDTANFYTGGTSEQRKNRALLRSAMEAEGFAVYEFEWWHFDYRDWHSYAVQNVRFADIH